MKFATRALGAMVIITASQAEAELRADYSPELKKAIRIVVEACGQHLDAQDIEWGSDKWGADIVLWEKPGLAADNIASSNESFAQLPEAMKPAARPRYQRSIAYFQCLDGNYDLMRTRFEDPSYRPSETVEAATAEAPPSPEETTREPLGRQDIQTVQQLLNDRGYDVGAPDGLMGPKTRNAIRAFQSAQGMPLTGEPDATLLAALRNGGGRNEWVADMEDPRVILDEEEQASQGGASPSAGPAQSQTDGASDGTRSRPPQQPATDEPVRTLEMSGQCQEDMRRIEADIARISRQAEGGAMAICEVHRANYEVLSNAAAVLRQCPSLNTPGNPRAEFERAAAESKAALDGPCS